MANTIKIKIEDAPVAPAAAPHEYQPIVKQIQDAGEGKVATVAFPTEEAALAFVKDMQKAANQLGVSAMRRNLVKNEDGTVSVSVGVRAKITRNRPTAAAVETASE